MKRTESKHLFRWRVGESGTSVRVVGTCTDVPLSPTRHLNKRLDSVITRC